MSTKLLPLLVTLVLVQSMALVVVPAGVEPPEPEDHPIVRWTVEVADPTNGTGRESTLALDSQDRPHMAHFDYWNVSLRYTTKVGGSWVTEVVDDSDLVGEFPSIAVDSQDRVHISYAPRQPLLHIPEEPPPPEPMIKALRYAVKTDSGWEKHIVWGPWAGYTSLALDPDDQPHISYTSHWTGAVHYATLEGAGWRHEEVDPEGFLDNAIAVDSEGNPHIAYARYAYGCMELYYAKWNGSAWEKEKIGLGGVILTDLALAIDEFDRRHLVWDGKDGMRYAIWNGSWVIQEIGPFHTSVLAMTLQGNSPRMFYQFSQDKYGVLEEGAWEWETINTTERTGVGTASHPLAIDGSGVPHLSAMGVFGWKVCLVYVTRNPLSAGPVADAGHDQTVNEGDTVQFNGTGSHAPDSEQEGWVNVSNIPTTRFRVAGTVLNDELYVIGGWEIPGFNETGAVEKYDPATDTWSSVAPIFEPHVSMAAGAAGGKLYAFGGYVGNESQTTSLEYDPATDMWVNRTQMPFARHNHAVAVVNDKVYVIGGSNSMIDCPTLNLVDEYDPVTDTWTPKAEMPTFREGLAAAVHDDKIYVIGGHAHCPGDASVSQKTVEVYDPATDTWTSARSIPTGRTQMQAETLNGRIYAMGGWNYTAVHVPEDVPARYIVEVYDIASDAWSLGDPMLETRSEFASGVVNGRIYVAAGHSNGMCFPPSPEWSEEYGPGTGELEYSWDFDSLTDSDGDGNFTDDADATGPTPTWIYGDNGDFTVTLKATDELGNRDTDTMNVTVLNIAPEVSVDHNCTGGGPADIMLRLAGEKWHDVTFAVLEDGNEIYNKTLVRMPGSPNEQMIGLEDFAMNGSRSYSVVAYYTPEDDPVNGQVWGATPAWIILRSGGNETARLHHTFNVRRPQTWLWRMDDLASYLPTRECTFTAYASDPGSDDLTFEWDFGDGTTAEHVYFNNGIRPDPYPSPEISPAYAADEARHSYASAGSYSVTLTVMDDDGGVTQVTFAVVL